VVGLDGVVAAVVVAEEGRTDCEGEDNEGVASCAVDEDHIRDVEH
jgi:hypothetical protein